MTVVLSVFRYGELLQRPSGHVFRRVAVAWLMMISLCGGPVYCTEVINPGKGSCGALAGLKLVNQPDAPAAIIDARDVPAANGLPSFCEVTGYVPPRIGFLLRLPRDWNGKLLEEGCGGFCGSLRHISECNDPLVKRYACIVSDGGHVSSDDDASWGERDLPSVIDYMVVASHVTALAGKAISAMYYGNSPTRSYFVGCSAGGEQAIMEAQRFPWDFDGIVAGQPTSEIIADISYLWDVLSFNDTDGRPLFTGADLRLLHDAVLKSCDRDDGVADGIVGNPLACNFEPQTLLCPVLNSSSCLTQRQVDAADNIYSGAVDSRGHHVSLPGALRGSELTWLEMYGGSNKQGLKPYHFAGEPFRYWLFQPAPGSVWIPENFDFDRDYKRLGVAEGLISPDNPDLRVFHSAGGKLLAYAGWNDTLGMPLSAIDYYETVERVMGGPGATQSFFRLFMIPGMNHCSGGDGAFQINYLSYLERWVEEDQPPNALIGIHPIDSKSANRGPSTQVSSLHNAATAFTRPIFPYPQMAQYSGSGDTRSASSFVSVRPKDL